MPTLEPVPAPDRSEMDTPQDERPSVVPLWRVRGFRLAVEAVAVVAAVVLATMAVATARQDAAAGGSPTEAEAAVRAYFAAVQQGDVAGALYAAGVDRLPDNEDGYFLRPDALSDEWELRSVRQLQASNVTRPGGLLADDHATVVVAIAGPAGEVASVEMRLRRTLAADGRSPGPGIHGRWRFAVPLVWVRFAPSPLWYVEVNGVRAPAGPGTEEQVYALLPGFYRFYSVLPAGVDARFVSHHPLHQPDPDASGALLLPWGYQFTVEPYQVALGPEVEETIVRAANAHIDRCAESRELMPAGCPFGAERSDHPDLPGGIVWWERAGPADWSVVEYPELAVVPGPEGIFITDRARGVVRLRADTDGGTAVEVECEMVLSRFEAGINADGSVSVGPTLDIGQSWFWDHRSIDPDHAGRDATTETTDTCRRPMAVD